METWNTLLFISKQGDIFIPIYYLEGQYISGSIGVPIHLVVIIFPQLLPWIFAIWNILIFGRLICTVIITLIFFHSFYHMLFPKVKNSLSLYILSKKRNPLNIFVRNVYTSDLALSCSPFVNFGWIGWNCCDLDPIDVGEWSYISIQQFEP